MNHSATDDVSQETENLVTKTRETRLPSVALVWAITLGEAVLWGTFGWFFADYWMMLPVRYRWAGILILAVLGAVGLFRLARFYRHFFREKRRRTSL